LRQMTGDVIMELFQLCGTDPRAGFSPYGWRAKLCLMHKGLNFEETPITFLEKDKIAHVSPQTIPVLDDGDVSVVDSLAIAKYLEKTYPDPTLFGGSVAEAQAPLLNHWIDTTLVMGMVRLVLIDIHAALDNESQVYFRESREKRFGCSLEDVMVDREKNREQFRKALAPLRSMLERNAFLSGDVPLWLDYAVFGTFMWPHVISNYVILAEDDVVYAWRERMFDLFDGAPRAAKRAC